MGIGGSRWFCIAITTTLVACGPGSDDRLQGGPDSPGGGEVDGGDGADGGDAALLDGAPDAAPPVQRGRCDTPPVAAGVLVNGVSDIDFSGEPVTAAVAHKLDIDVEEDGCIVGARFAVRKANLGCELTLEYASVDGRPVTLVQAQLAADSFCPGWSDDDEGVYVLSGGAPALDFVTAVPDRTARRSCIGQAAARLVGRIELRREDGRTLDVVLDGLSVTGDFWSEGDTDTTCPCTPLCAGRACGDDGCGGTCAPGCDGGETCGPDGRCQCVPQCAGRGCGDDGCGGQCGPGCGADTVCNAETGRCDCVPACEGRACGDDGCGGRCEPGCSDGTECEPATGQCVVVCPDRVCEQDFLVETPPELAALAACGHVVGDVYFHGNELDSLVGLECLRSVSGVVQFRFTSLPEVTALSRLARVGTLSIESNHTMERISFDALAEVDEVLGISDQPAVETLAFPALRQVGHLGLGGCDLLTDLAGFAALDSLGSLSIEGNDALASLHALAGVRALRYLSVRRNPVLASLQGLGGAEGLQALVDGASIIDNRTLRDLRGLDHITETHSITLRDNAGLRSLEGLEALRRIEGRLIVERNSALADTAPLSALESVGDTLELTNMPTLVSVLLPALTTVDDLTLEGVGVPDLDGLRSVERVGGHLRLNANRQLVSLQGLEQATVTGNIYIQNNRALNQCEAETFVGQVTEPGWRGSAHVTDNGDREPCP